ncbi:MAG: YHS domain-containing (seleno)protein [Pseudomonadota bacterium]
MPSVFRLTVAALALSVASSAYGGEEYTAANGFAASGYDVVAYFDMDQAPVGSDQPAAVPGQSSITAEYDGATYAFSSVENRDRFLADPASYAPQYDGHCAYGVAQGGKVPGNPNLWRIVDNKLYLNITKNVVGFWEEDIPGNLQKSETNWASIESEPASTMAIPQFEPSAPVN